MRTYTHGLTRSLERTAAPLLRSTPGGSSEAPRALHRSCRRLSLSSGVRRIRACEARVGRFGLAFVADLARVASLGLSLHTEDAERVRVGTVAGGPALAASRREQAGEF